jgi:hypothetical protein
MNRGYIKLWRKMEDSGLMQRPEIFTFAAWCLFRASYKERKVLHGGQVIPLEPGQFIFGRKAAAEALKTTERKIRTALSTLDNIGFLTIKPTNKYSIITIVNWATYQNDDQPSDQQTDQVPTSNRPATDHKQEVKEVKKEKKKEKELPPEALRLARVLSELILRNNPENRELQNSKREASEKRWAKDLDKMNRIDHRDWESIEKCIRWSQDDPFWSGNILSGEKVRAQYDKMLMDARKRKDKPKPTGSSQGRERLRRMMENGEMASDGTDNGSLRLLPEPPDER